MANRSRLITYLQQTYDPSQMRTWMMQNRGFRNITNKVATMSDDQIYGISASALDEAGYTPETLRGSQASPSRRTGSPIRRSTAAESNGRRTQDDRDVNVRQSNRSPKRNDVDNSSDDMSMNKSGTRSPRKSQAKTNPMSRQEVGHLGGIAEHKCRGLQVQEGCVSDSGRPSRAKPDAMTPQEVGHLGGIAPHRCRGLACTEAEDEDQGNKYSQSRSKIQSSQGKSNGQGGNYSQGRSNGQMSQGRSNGQMSQGRSNGQMSQGRSNA
jgi:hypothetical protein